MRRSKLLIKLIAKFYLQWGKEINDKVILNCKHEFWAKCILSLKSKIDSEFKCPTCGIKIVKVDQMFKYQKTNKILREELKKLNEEIKIEEKPQMVEIIERENKPKYDFYFFSKIFLVIMVFIFAYCKIYVPFSKWRFGR